nr:terminase TerL endonuclease subunit [Clostridioides mangenotii]
MDVISKKKLYEKINCSYITEWIDIVDSEKYPVSNEIKQLNELLKLKFEKQDIYVDIEKVEGVIELIERYRPYELTPVQKFLHSIPYIFFKDGRTVFRKIFIYCGRGFGKNSWISDLTFGLTSNKNGIHNYNVDMVATSEDQAQTSFNDIYETIGEYSKLQGAYYRSKELIKFKKTNSEIKYYTSNAKTKDGLRPGAVVFDEIHAYEDYENIKVFTSALGKVKHARIFYITTDGNTRGSVLDDMKEEGRQVLREKDINSRMFPFMASINKYEEWSDPKCWIKANPMLPYLPDLQDEYEESYKDALKNPQLKMEFLLKRLNYQIEDVTTAVANWEEIKATDQEFPNFEGYQCVGGIDYASVRDFIGVGLMFKKDGKYYFKHHTFIVAESLRLAEYKIDLELAKEKGLVTIIPGNTMNEEYISEWFLKEIQENNYRLINIGCDDYRAAILKKDFEEKGLPLETVRNGPITHGKLAPVIEKAFAEHKIIYGDDMMMRWYTNNVKVVTNSKGNKTYEKIEPQRRKTDGFMAFVHAMALREQISVNTFTYNKKLKTYTY